MSVTYGFYNSLNGDRKYDAIQLSSLFDGLITDGVFASIGTCFAVKAKGGLTVDVGIGKAWFNHTWTLNDAVLPLEAPDSDVLLDRIDAVVLEVDSSEFVRANSIKFVQGTPSSQPVRPTMASSETLHQYPLCYIYRAAGSTEITQADITNMVGTEETPFITGILQTISLDELLGQWEDEFDQFLTSGQADFLTWFNQMKGQLSEDAAGNLQLEIEAVGETLNSIISLQPFRLIYEGTQRDGKSGSGVAENSLAEKNYCVRFTLTGSTEIGRVVLKLDKDGDGADVTIQIRSGMNPAAGQDGTLLKEMVLPKEFIPTTAANVSIPVGLAGLTSGGTYWLVVKQAGDASNKVDMIGETTQDANYPAYSRVGDSGAWTANNALHFAIYSGESGELVHGIYGADVNGTGVAGFTTVEYSNEVISKVYRYLPPSDGAAGGIRNVVDYVWSGEYLKGGEM